MRAQLRSDPLLGTAFPAARVLLVEQPGAWGHGGLRESDFDPVIARALERRANAAGVRVLAIRRPGRTPAGTRRRWMFADTRTGHESLRWAGFDRDAELLELPLDGALGEHGSVGEPDDAALYLVCAHGRHDACCALRGRPVAQALAHERPGRVWECSHVGGERFAANVLVLPFGLMYGQVLAYSAPEFVSATEAGEVVGALLRGRIGLPPAAQAALAFAHEHLAVRRRDALRVRGTSTELDGRCTVHLDGPHGRLDVTVRIEPVAADGLTCNNPRPNFYLAYHPVAIVAPD